MIKESFYRSPLFYVGDKFKLVPTLISYFPETINKFVEPFVGGGSVFLNVKANEYFLNDIDYYVYKLHLLLLSYRNSPEVFLNQIKTLINKFHLSKSFDKDIIPVQMKMKWKKTYYAHYNREAYNKLKFEFNNSKEKNFMKLYLLLIYGFNRMLRFNSRGEYNVPVGNVDFNRNVYNSLKDYFCNINSKIVNCFNIDYKEFIDSIKFEKDDFIYLDPPYLISFSEYNKYWNEDRERELIKVIDSLNDKNIKFAASNLTHYKNKVNSLFNKWSKNFKIHLIKSNYISYHDNSNKNLREVLVTNYE